jgi:uncharacterized protein (DUF2141 family)
MKTHRIFSFAAITLLIVAWAFNGLAQTTNSGTLLVLVNGLDDTRGQLLVAIYNEKNEFLSAQPAMGTGTAISRTAQVVKFEKVPYGEYAVAVIHDQNNDGILDKNFIGIPTEGYGFSNNAMGDFGPPSFDDASFKVADNCTTQVIALKYGTGK